VPQVRESFVDSVLFVLHDWSCAISCEQDALDAERGVISEEWRRKDEPRTLVADLQNKIIYKGAKHAERNVLGTLEIINGFERQEILDFYHKWYRPDLQAIAIVGDIDVDDMEERVKKIFSGIPAQEILLRRRNMPFLLLKSRCLPTCSIRSSSSMPSRSSTNSLIHL
jgi:zinc protease